MGAAFFLVVLGLASVFFLGRIRAVLCLLGLCALLGLGLCLGLRLGGGLFGCFLGLGGLLGSGLLRGLCLGDDSAVEHYRGRLVLLALFLDEVNAEVVLEFLGSSADILADLLEVFLNIFITDLDVLSLDDSVDEQVILDLELCRGTEAVVERRLVQTHHLP